MAYQKKTWVTGETKILAEDMARIEEAISQNEANLENKQPKGNYLTEHQKIKTINGQSLVGEGNIIITAPVKTETVTGQSIVISDAQDGKPVELIATGYTKAYGKSKNLFDPVKAADANNYSIVKVANDTVQLCCLTFQLKPNTAYTMSRTKIEDVDSYPNINIGTTAARASLLNNSSGSITTLDDGLLYFGTPGSPTDPTTYLSAYTDIQLEEGSAATEYEPYRDKQGVNNAGNLDEDSGKYVCTVNFKCTLGTISAVANLDKPLSKWDYICKKDGVWGVSYNSETIESYNGESIDAEFVTATGELVVGQPVQYKADTETFVEFDNETAALFESLEFNGVTEVTSDCGLTFTITYEAGEGGAAESRYVSVKEYGAVGDGETDDTVPIRTARDAAVLMKKPLYFPAGTYLLSNTIQIYSDMHIIGEKGAKLTKYAAVTQNLAADAEAGATSVSVSDASQFTVGRDIYIGAAGINGGYADTVGYITAIDTDTNTIHFEVYPRHSTDPAAGLNRAVTIDGIVSSTFSMLCTFSKEDAGGNIKIEGLEFDGNKQSGEAQMYSLSPINIDPNNLNVTIRDCKVVNSPADGISIQNNGQTTVDNCIVESPTYHGIHPGYSINGVSITNCYIYDCPNSGVYDCYNVNGLTVSNCYIVNCYMGVGGLDEYSNGSNIVGCTFERCTTGVRLGAVNGGASVSGCSFQNCGEAVIGYVGGNAAVNGCAFVECTTAFKMQRAREIAFVGNTIRECATPVLCGVQIANPTLRSSNIIIADNIVYSSADGKASSFNLNYLDNAIVKNNILVGTDAAITVDTGTTSGLVISDNIGTVTETDSTAS